MKPGDKIPIVLIVIRPVAHGETINGEDDQPVEILNPRNNKFWASKSGTEKGQCFLICNDGETEAGLIKRRAIVDLIECGVAG